DTGGTAAPPAIQYLYDDALGSIQTTAASDGTFRSARDYGRFGRLRTPGTNDATVPYGFTGHEEDPELGLVNMRGRMYDPHVGQFMSADPIVSEPFRQGLNR